MTEFAHPLSLTEIQHKRLLKGNTVQLKSEQLHGGGVHIKVTHKNHKTIERAKRKSTGARITLGPEEIEMNGGNLMHKLDKVGNKILKGLRTVGKSGFLQPLMTYGLASAGMDPVEAGIASSIATKVVNKGKTVKPAFNIPQPAMQQLAPPQPPMQQGYGLMLSTKGKGKGLVMSTGRGSNKKTIIL